jgi:hypothetical protein
MIRKSHLLLALALVAAAVAAPIAQADSPQGQVTIPAYLSKIHYPGNSVPVPDMSKRHVAVPPWLGRIRVAPVAGADSLKPVDPLAVSYLTGLGLSPSQVTSWTSGPCSHEARSASCYAMFHTTTVSTPTSNSIGFQWADAGIGAGFTLGVLLLLGGATAGFLISRQGRRRQTAHA